MLPEEIINKLDILPVEKLRTHEETIPYNLQKLKEGMLNMGRLVDPLVIDNKKFVVVDGNHRKKVLESIKCPNAACQLVDYHSPEIGVGSWFLASKTVKPDEVNGFKPEKVDFEAGMDSINRMKSTFLYVKSANGKKECYLYDAEQHGITGVIDHQRKFLSALEGRDILYIIGEAVAGRHMPPKSTRHMIPDRIIRLNLHLGWLSEQPEVAKQMMDNMLRKRLTEGAIRRYTEPVIVLY
ncbi:MAG: hypothetical protein NTV88_01930 [Candidatus Micrarchaeota archaeon]|nr:hypothetical protein [Candidatus Micrarchaeota archaeon]